MPIVHLPDPGRPHVLVEAAGSASILDVDADEVIALYKQHGALLFRGFGVDVDQFRQFARSFCSTSVMNESPGRSPIDTESNIHTVDKGNRAFSFHPELSREPWKPDAAFFACLSPPSQGGETTICDGVALVKALPAALRDAFGARRLLYVKGTWPALLDYWLGDPDPDDRLLASPPPSCPYFFRRIEGQVVRIFTRPALHRPMFCDEPAFGNFLLFARFNNNRPDFPLLDDGNPVPEPWLQAFRAAGDAVGAAVAWQTGDTLMLDNTRFMHGRQPILDTQERLIATYFGYVRFALRDPEEPVDPPWRRGDFYPPIPPDLPR